jgi:hypothetical protein
MCIDDLPFNLDGDADIFLGGLTFDTPVPYEPISQFWNPNITFHEMDKAWDDIDTNPMAVALHDDFTRSVGLPPSGRFPWDTERSIYYLKGLHDLHCVVCLHIPVHQL